MVSHAHREGSDSTEPVNVNVARLRRKIGVVYQPLDNDEIQFTNSADITATENNATSSVQESPAPEMNETKTTT